MKTDSLPMRKLTRLTLLMTGTISCSSGGAPRGEEPKTLPASAGR